MRIVAGIVAGLASVITMAVARADQAPPSDTGCRIVWAQAIADAELTAGVRLGGLSDLVPASHEPGHYWAITDRGPNGTLERGGEKFRTLLAPDFAPCLVLLDADPLEANREPTIAVERVIPLGTPAGKPLTGRPVGGSHQVSVLSADGSSAIAADPDGVDTEAVVPAHDGGFWVAEEYGPSLLKIGPDGKSIERHVPAGTAASSAMIPQRETIPADYALRRDNRGFEAIAASPDDTKLWLLLQSPLDNPAPKAAKKSGNVRLVVFDTVAGRVTAEHLYRLGDPTDPEYLTKGAPPDDGKLCCMARFGKDGLLVLEQDDAGHAKLYAVSLAGATNTLGWKPPRNTDVPSIEKLRNLPSAGILPVSKRLVADVSTLRATMAATADGGEEQHGLLKIEGLAIVDDRHVLLLNDDDFGVQGKGQERRRSFMWLIEFDKPLSSVFRKS